MPFAEVLAKRRTHIGPNTTLNYKRPLHMVRGEGCHLYDADGIEYLDCVNNVAHVGHCNPMVRPRGLPWAMMWCSAVGDKKRRSCMHDAAAVLIACKAKRTTTTRCSESRCLAAHIYP